MNGRLEELLWLFDGVENFLLTSGSGLGGESRRNRVGGRKIRPPSVDLLDGRLRFFLRYLTKGPLM